MGQFLDVALDCPAQERYGPRVLHVAHEKIECGSETRRGDIPRSVHANAVADVEQPFDLRLSDREFGFDMLGQQAADELQTFDAPADAQKPPACILRHIVQCKTRERCERQQQTIEYGSGLLTRSQRILHLVLHVGDRAPIAAR